MKSKRGDPGGAEKYREINNKVKKGMTKAKEMWVRQQCQEVEGSLSKNNSRRAYQLVKKLTAEKNGRTTTIQDKDGNCLTEEKEVLGRWTEYCSELYNYELQGDPSVLDCPQHYPDMMTRKFTPSSGKR